jgi:hypothetical protein
MDQLGHARDLLRLVADTLEIGDGLDDRDRAAAGRQPPAGAAR